MATEDIRIENGQLTVERPEHKPSIDVDLSTVERIHFERSLDPSADGALVLFTAGGGEHLIRVSNEDDNDVLGNLYDKWRGSRRDAVKDTPDLFDSLEEDAPKA